MIHPMMIPLTALTALFGFLRIPPGMPRPKGAELPRDAR